MSINFTPTPASSHQRKANWDHKYRHQNMSVDMDVWYPFLKSITFKTYFIPLKYREAEAVLNFNFFRNKNQPDKFTKEDTEILRNLEKKVDHYFQTYDDLKNGAMFRLSGRSGKDMDYYDNKKIMSLYEQNLDKVAKIYGTDKNDVNTKYVAICTLMNRFKVNSGKDVLNVLLTSERLFLDLKDWLNHGGKEQMILRVWDDSLCSDREFRAFIQNNELKAICQDERFAMFKNMVENKDLYEKLINDYFNKSLKPLMKIPNYIADFCILKNNEVKLIEFSPFLRCTSACLFRWDINYEEMLNGTGKLTIRDKVCENLDYFVNEWLTYQGKPSDPFDNYFIEDEEKESIFDKTKKILSYVNPLKLFAKKENIQNKIQEKKEEEIIPKKVFENRKIFVVSVLKTGFFWSHKYITYDGSENKSLGKGVLEDHTIYVDKNGFGWIMEKKGKKCYGEVIDVEYEDFLEVEFFYGQRDTTMKKISVKIDDKYIEVYAYVIKEIFENVKSKESDDKCEIEEYTIDMQNEKFNSMQHIINQQERYLNMSLDFDLKDSW